MVTARNQPDQNRYPNIVLREVEGRSEAYLHDSGLAIWEIAWLSRSYDGDARVIAENHTIVDVALIEEGLKYAAEHTDEIDSEIRRHTERPLDELLTLLPGMKVVTFEKVGVDPQLG